MGQRAIGIGVYVPVNQLNVVKFGKKLEGLIENIAEDYPSVEFKKVFFQPDRVSTRIKELGKSLLMGMFLVSIVFDIFLRATPWSCCSECHSISNLYGLSYL